MEFVPRKFIRALEDGNLDALCDLFEGMADQIPASAALFFIIDGLSFYERKDRVQNTCILMSRIVGIADNMDLCSSSWSVPGRVHMRAAASSTINYFDFLTLILEDNGKFDHNVETFEDQAGIQARSVQAGLMRTDSESAEGF
ncbi:hypothetical protein MMC12_003744 [Toensbergia leucococca]|nr:hypothetical protein [Toensbergia leucococca]